MRVVSALGGFVLGKDREGAARWEFRNGDTAAELAAVTAKEGKGDVFRSG